MASDFPQNHPKQNPSRKPGMVPPGKKRKLTGILPLYLQKQMEQRAAEEAAMRAAQKKMPHPPAPFSRPAPAPGIHSPTSHPMMENLPKKNYSSEAVIPAQGDKVHPAPHIPGRPKDNSLNDRFILWYDSFTDAFPEFTKKWFWITIIAVLSLVGFGVWKATGYYHYRQSPQWAMDELTKMGIQFSPHNFLWAVERNDKRAIDLFFKAKVNPNEVDAKDYTPLMIMAERGDYDKVRLLVESGVNINYQNAKGQSAIRLALDNKNVPIYRFLRQAGAKNIINFFSAIKYADSQSIEELINERIPLKNVNEKIDPQLEVFGDKLRYKINQYDDEGATPLLWACMRGDVKTVELLLNNQADVNAPEKKEGQTPLMVAASSAIDPVMVPLINYNANMNLRDKKGRTALFLAVVQNKPSAIGILLAGGADPNIGERTQGLSVVSAAAFLNNPQVVAALVDSGADVLQPDYRGLSAMDHAAANSSVESINILIKKAGKAYLGKQENILTAIKIAEKQGNQKIVDLLKPLVQ